MTVDCRSMKARMHARPRDPPLSAALQVIAFDPSLTVIDDFFLDDVVLERLRGR